MGLKNVYSKPTPTQLLEGNGNRVLGYVHGINALTINEDNRLRRQVAEQEHTIQVQLAQVNQENSELKKEMGNMRDEWHALLSEPEKFMEMLQEGRGIRKTKS
jgi:hypothetical protein